MGFPQFATQGWNMFETHYLTGGACPPVLSAHSGGLQWLDPITNAWESVETVPGITYNWRWNESGTDCLNRDDGTGRGYYYTLTFPSSQDWYVDSYPSQVPQPPTGGECDPAVSDCCDTYGACSCDLYNLDQCCGVSGGGFGAATAATSFTTRSTESTVMPKVHPSAAASMGIDDGNPRSLPPAPYPAHEEVAALRTA